jgi:hypothetical protein
MKGTFDGINAGAVFGWAFDPAQPAKRHTVQLLINGKVRAEMVADVHRGDLEDSGFGDGCCAYSLALPQSVYDGDYHEVAVRIHGQKDLLTGSPKWVICEE